MDFLKAELAKKKAQLQEREEKLANGNLASLCLLLR